MKLFPVYFSSLLFLLSISRSAQVAVTTDGSRADPLAMFEVKSNSRGLLLPGMTTAERDAIPSEAAGFEVWCSDCDLHGEKQASNGFPCINTGGAYYRACGGSFTDPRVGKNYCTILIATQCWALQNLNTESMLSGGSAISNIGIIEKYCYNNLTANCDKFGGIYGWDVMIQFSTIAGSRGFCPSGWLLPNDGEWCLLKQYLDVSIIGNSTSLMGTTGGGKIKEVGPTNWTAPNTGVKNTS